MGSTQFLHVIRKQKHSKIITDVSTTMEKAKHIQAT